MTTLGATTSKTLAKALFSWWTTSLPCSAAAAGTVGLGGSSGVAPKSEAAPKVENVRKNRMKRIGSKLDSIEHATFNAAVHCTLGHRWAAFCKAKALTGDILSVVSLRICVQ